MCALIISKKMTVLQRLSFLVRTKRILDAQDDDRFILTSASFNTIMLEQRPQCRNAYLHMDYLLNFDRVSLCLLQIPKEIMKLRLVCMFHTITWCLMWDISIITLRFWHTRSHDTTTTMLSSVTQSLII